MVDQTISHYKIIRKIGEGGMGTIYLAQDLQLERNVAIKFLPGQLTKDKDSAERFRREAKAAAALNHPNIVTIHEIIESDNQLCIVMEYVQGKTLRDQLIANSQMSITDLTSIISQIASGMSAAHRAGIVHRDIKPENILINQEGQVKILDFGLAKLKGMTNLTQENSTLGTIHYMSPEQTKGEFVDHRSDIWSLGVVLYEMATGQKPFKGDYEQAIVYSILNEEVTGLAELPEGVGVIIDRCLQKNPEDRYESIEELSNDIKPGAVSNNSVRKLQSTSQTSRSSIWYIIPALVATLIILYFVVQFWPYSSEEQEKWINSIAVLPFDDLSAEKDQGHFCMGMTEQILSNLSQLNDLKVIARTSVMQYKNTQKSISEIASELDVSNILGGSIQRSGEKIRINVQLINASTGAYLWSENYDSNLNDLFSLQDDVSRKVADVLNFKLRIGESDKVKELESMNTEAYEYCLKGEYISRYYLLTQKLSDHLELFELAEDHFQKALQLEPDYIRAKLGLAEHYLAFTFLHGDEEMVNWAKKIADEILLADPNNVLAITLQGAYYYESEELESSFKYFKRALKLNANEGKANYYIAQFFKKKGLYHQAKFHLEKAVQVDPLNTRYLFECGLVNQDLGLFEQADKNFNKLYEINPDHVLGRFILFFNNLYIGNIEQAAKYYTEHMQMFPDFDLNDQMRASYYAAMGEREKSLEIEDSNITNYLLLDMKEEAIQTLIHDVEGYDEGENIYLDLIHFPPYNQISNDPRIQDLTAGQKVIYEDNLKKYVKSNKY